MSMVLALRKVSDSQLESFHKNPKQIIWFLTGVEEEKSFLQKLFSNKTASSKKWEEPSEEEQTDLDKAWQGLHFLFTSTASDGTGPASYLLTGKPIGNVDVVGYGPAMSLSSKEVAEFNAYLEAIDENTLKAKYDAKKMTELDIYPNIWMDNLEAVEYLLENFKILKTFVGAIAKEKKALIIYLI